MAGVKAPVKFTAAASKVIKDIFNQPDIEEGQGLRLGMRSGGGCSSSGMSYLLGIDTKKEEDFEYEFEGIKIFIDKTHAMYVAGKQIDYAESEEATGFIFESPTEIAKNKNL